MRFYRALLRLYPASFRAEYRDELCYAFAERARELSGPLARVRIVLAALADVIPNAHRGALGRPAPGPRATPRARSRRTPGFALTAVLVVALGVGANTAVFSLADFVLRAAAAVRRRRPAGEALAEGAGYGSMSEASPANYRDWKRDDHLVLRHGRVLAPRREPRGRRRAAAAGDGARRRRSCCRSWASRRCSAASSRREDVADGAVRRAEPRALAVAIRRRPERDRHVRPARRRAAHRDRRDAGVVPVPVAAPSRPGRRSSCAKRTSATATTTTSTSSRVCVPASPSSRRARSWRS